MTDIFLSYNREDQSTAKLFADGFESRGYTVWWDTTLRAGEAYDEVTEAALRSAKAVVVLWSQKSVISRWVRAEALAALRNNTLVPCMIEPCERPIMFELTQSAEFFGWKGDQSDPRWTSLLLDVQALIGKNQSDLSAAAPTSAVALRVPQAKPSKRGLLLAGAGAALGLSGIALVLGRDQIGTIIGPKQGDHSVAVLPFINISGDDSHAYFADGLSAEIRAELAGNPLLRVVAQTSSATFKVRSATAQDMARKLGVAYLLDGNVRKAVGTARVNTELIDGKSGISVWAQTFNRPLDDIFAVQSEIANAVVSALVARIPEQSQSQGKASDGRKQTIGGTMNRAAFENYLKGKALYESALSLETDQQSLFSYEAAIALDPNYAAAHSGRALALSVIANQSGDATILRKNRQLSLAAAQRAVDLAPTFATGHSILAFILFTTGLDVRGARASFDKSLQYGAGDGDVVVGFAMFCARTGRQVEAETNIKRGMNLDPLNPGVFRNAGQIEAIARRHDQAIALYQRALSMNPKASVTNYLMGMEHVFSQRNKEAKQSFEAEPNKQFGLTGLAIVEARLGNGTAAKAFYDKLVAAYGDGTLFQQAQIHAAMGNKDAALSTLERAYVVGDPGLATLYTDPIFDDIRQESRFSQLLKSIGFE